jgi:small subunit ribosomal protein S18
MKKKLSKLRVSSRLLKKRMRRKGAMTGGKQCLFCSNKEQEAHLDYKNATLLRGFLTERGKILPSRISGVCAGHQRHLSAAIKKARVMALIPYMACQY